MSEFQRMGIGDVWKVGEDMKEEVRGTGKGLRDELLRRPVALNLDLVLTWEVTA